MKLPNLLPSCQLAKTVKVLKRQNDVGDDPPVRPHQSQLAKSLKVLRNKKC